MSILQDLCLFGFIVVFVVFFVAVNFWIFTCGHDWEFLQGPLKSQKDTLPESNSKSTRKMDSWKIDFLLGWPIFRDDLLVSGSVV